MKAQAVLTSTNQNILTCAIGTSLAVKGILCCNTNATTPDYINIHWGISGNDTDVIVKQVTINPNATFIMSDAEVILMEAGESIISKSNNGTTTITISYMEL